MPASRPLPPPTDAMRIVLTGGIACGKSLFAKFLRELGIRLIDADDVVHELEASGGAAVEAIAARFGEGVRAPDGGIDRRRLAQVVFAPSRASTALRVADAPSASAPCFAPDAARRDLEAILHPLVRARLLDFLDAPAAPPSVRSAADGKADAPPLRIAVVPLLFESHWEKDYDIILCIHSSAKIQMSRMTSMRGYSREEAEARLAAQMPVAEKARRSDLVVVNDGSPEELQAEAQRVAEWLNGKMRHEH